MVVVDRVKICLISSLITIQNLVVVSHTVCAHVGGPKCEPLGPTIWDGGVADALETRHSPHVVITNFVALGQTVWAYVNVGVQKYFGDAAPRPWVGGVAEPIKHATPPYVLPHQISSL